MLLHAQREGLKTEVEEEGVLGCWDAAEVAHELRYEVCGVTEFAECINIGEAVVGLVGGG